MSVSRDDGGSLVQPEWLARWRNTQLTTDEALLRFDGLDAVGPEELTGRCRGTGLYTGHRLDGLLERFGWYGKGFVTSESVHPLLFQRSDGRIYSVDPARLPIGLALAMPSLARSDLARALFVAWAALLRTSSPTARLRKIEYRGVASAAIVYDRIPVIDYLRRVDGKRVLGLMDMRSEPQPFFFMLVSDNLVG